MAKAITNSQPSTPFERFKQLTEKLLTVPKKELDAKVLEYERTRKRKKAKKR